MNVNPFMEAREKLPSAISTLPQDFLKGNAGPLLAIIEELKKSYRVELLVIQAIKNLDVARSEAVDQLAREFENYHQYRDFDSDRTHCHNIDRVARTLLVPLEAQTQQSDRERVTQVKKLLEPLRTADNDFMDDIESLMERALIAMKSINDHVQAGQNDPARLNDARNEHQKFVREFGPLFDQLKTRLKEMNSLANKLIDYL